MVKIKVTETLRNYLVLNQLSSKEIYEYKEIREVLTQAPASILDDCSFAWPEKQIPKSSPYIEMLKQKQKVREYENMVSNISIKQPEGLVELKFGLGIGITLISILFVGMLSGYYLGKYFFGLNTLGSLVVSFIVTVIGIYAEVILYLMRIDKEKGKIKVE